MLYGSYYDINEGAEESLSERAQLLLKALIENYIRDGQPVGSRTLSRDSGLSLSVGHHPQRHGGPRGSRVRRLAAHLGRAASPPTRATGCSSTRLLKLKPLQNEEIEDIERRLASDASNGRSLVQTRLADALERDPHGGPGHAAESELRRALADRVHRLVGEPGARHHGHEQPRGAEPGGAARPPLLAGGAAARRQLPERGVLGPLPARRAGAPARAAAGDPPAHGPAHAGRHPGRAEGVRRPSPRGRWNTSSPGRPTSWASPSCRTSTGCGGCSRRSTRSTTSCRLLDNCLRAEGIQIFIGQESGYRILDDISVVTAPYIAGQPGGRGARASSDRPGWPTSGSSRSSM